MSSRTAPELHLAFMTQLVDETDPVLGFVTNWCQALASRVERLTVIANEVRSVPVDAAYDVVSLGKETGAGRAARTWRLRRALDDLVPAPTFVLAHMCPAYLVAAATTRAGVRAERALWYAHPALTPEVRFAHVLAHKVLTSLPGAYPLRGRKVRVIGQATDTSAYLETPAPDDSAPLRLVAVGRTSPYKGFDLAIQAVRNLVVGGADVYLDVVGPSTTPDELRHRGELEDLAAAPELKGRVRLLAPVRPKDLPGLYSEYHALVNATEDGSGDKVVFEAMAAGRHVVLTNPSFARVLEAAGVAALLRPRNAAGIAGGIQLLVETPPAVRGAQRAALRETVQRGHALSTFGDRAISALSSD